MDKLEKIRQLALANEATLISDAVKKDNEYYEFEDLEGNRFEIQAKYIQKKGWPKNIQAYLKRSEKLQKTDEDFFNKMKEIAKINNGQLLSTEWKGINSQYKFLCADKKILTRSYLALIRYGWFKRDYVINEDTLKEKYNKLKNFAENHGGKIISLKWLGYKVKHDFIDSDGTIFSASPERLYKGQWGVYSSLIAEPICQQIFEYIFGYAFIKTRNVLTPEVTGRKKSLELDGYCAELNMAFEYQGHPSHWDKKHKNYLKVSINDAVKKELCEKNKIKLIIIPTFPEDYIKLSSYELFNLVLDSIKASNVKIEINQHLKEFNDFEINYLNLSYGKKKMKKLNQEIKAYGGKLLSKEWRGSDYKYNLEWNDGRRFTISYDKLRTNGWPKNLDKYLSWSIGHKKTPDNLWNELNEIAKKHNVKLLTQKWLGNNKKYEFETADKTRFFLTAQSMKRRSLPCNEIKKTT